MDWPLLLALLLVAGYACVAVFIYARKMWVDRISFYGPFMAIKTARVGFFDWFSRFRTFLRIYGTVGVLMVAVVSVLMTFLLFSSLQMTIVQKPPPTAANELRNVFAIPGLNDFIPLTFAVIFGLIITMVVHEFGHAILCRIEGIRVKSMGLLVAVVPIGAFVEPDEEDLEKTKGLPKMRMLGAGITNNILAGIICFVLLIALLGFAVPVNVPLVKSVYEDSPAYAAGVQPDSIITDINGIPVSSVSEVSLALNRTLPGDKISLTARDSSGGTSTYDLTLAPWPPGLGERTNGFMGVNYYDVAGVRQTFSGLLSPVGFLILLAAPIEVIVDPVNWDFTRVLMNTSVDAVSWNIPFPFFWQFIQILFWCGWWNLAVGTFNALPVIPLDGGYITKEGVDRVLDRKGLIRFSDYIMTAIGMILVIVIIAIFTLPKLFHPGA